MSYLDDQLPDFSALQLPEDGLIFSPSSPATSEPSAPASSSSPFPYGATIKAGGQVLSGIGEYMQGQEAAGADEYNASLALMKGQFDVEEITSAEAETLSTQKAMYAKSGVEQTGSVLDTALNTATNYEYDKQVATFKAQSEANMYNYEAKMAKQKGEFGLAGGLIQGGASLLMALA